MKKIQIPASVQNSIWWQDIHKINIEKDEKMLIKAILQKGNWGAIQWMKSTFQKKNIKEVFQNSYKTEFSPKTYNFWKVILGVSPQFNSRIDKIQSI